MQNPQFCALLSSLNQTKLAYLAVYGCASMGVGELQSTLAPTTDCDWSAIGPPRHFFCHGQKRDYLSRNSQRARGATKN